MRLEGVQALHLDAIRGSNLGELTLQGVMADGQTLSVGRVLGSDTMSLALDTFVITANDLSLPAYADTSASMKFREINFDIQQGLGTTLTPFETDANQVTLHTTLGSINAVLHGDSAIKHISAENGHSIALTGDTALRITGDLTVPKVVTTGTLSLSALDGIGGFQEDRLFVQVGSLQASNTRSGDIVIADADNLIVGAGGVVNQAADGWVVLMNGAATRPYGNLSFTGQRMASLAGMTYVTERDLNAAFWLADRLADRQAQPQALSAIERFNARLREANGISSDHLQDLARQASSLTHGHMGLIGEMIGQSMSPDWVAQPSLSQLNANLWAALGSIEQAGREQTKRTEALYDQPRRLQGAPDSVADLASASDEEDIA